MLWMSDFLYMKYVICSLLLSIFILHVVISLTLVTLNFYSPLAWMISPQLIVPKTCKETKTTRRGKRFEARSVKIYMRVSWEQMLELILGGIVTRAKTCKDFCTE